MSPPQPGPPTHGVNKPCSMHATASHLPIIVVISPARYIMDPEKPPRIAHGERDETSRQTHLTSNDDPWIMLKFCSHHNRIQAQYNPRNNGIPDHLTVSYECPFTQDTSGWEILAIHTVVFQHSAVWYTVISVHEGIRYVPSRHHGSSKFLSNVSGTYQTRHSHRRRRSYSVTHWRLSYLTMLFFNSLIWFTSAKRRWTTSLPSMQWAHIGSQDMLEYEVMKSPTGSQGAALLWDFSDPSRPWVSLGVTYKRGSVAD